MMHNLIDRIGDWNPQLLRELKGRLKVFNVAIALAISLLGQLVLFLYQLREFPGDKYLLTDKYCHPRSFYEPQQELLYGQSSELYRQLDSYKNTKPSNPDKILELNAQIKQLNIKISDLSNNFCPIDQINVQLWWRDHWKYIFLGLSVIFIFTLLVAGTYLLINNLAQEERRGTLNFIRLSPQSETSILQGKLLGVPILIYLVILTAVPLHFWAGHSANIAFNSILRFYVIVPACCIFFYSAALLFGLCCRWFSGFQPWFGSGVVLLFLIITMQLAVHGSDHTTPWLRLLSPFDIMGYMFPNSFQGYNWELLEKLQFFYLPLGKNIDSIVSLHLLNYAFWTYWFWQGMKRCFRNPNLSILSKGQPLRVRQKSKVTHSKVRTP